MCSLSLSEPARVCVCVAKANNFIIFTYLSFGYDTTSCSVGASRSKQSTSFKNQWCQARQYLSNTEMCNTAPEVAHRGVPQVRRHYDTRYPRGGDQPNLKGWIIDIWWNSICALYNSYFSDCLAHSRIDSMFNWFCCGHTGTMDFANENPSRDLVQKDNCTMPRAN